MSVDAIELNIAMTKELLTSDQRPSREEAKAVGDAAKKRCDEITAGETIQWLTDRLTNCIRLGSLKRGEDQAGWVEDAAHFAAALNLLSLSARRCEKLQPVLEEYEKFVEWLGPCDHEVNHCRCKEERILADARAVVPLPSPAP